MSQAEHGAETPTPPPLSLGDGRSAPRLEAVDTKLSSPLPQTTSDGRTTRREIPERSSHQDTPAGGFATPWMEAEEAGFLCPEDCVAHVQYCACCAIPVTVAFNLARI